jgi:acyl carrier protein
MNKEKIIKEIAEILLLDDEFDLIQTSIEFDSLSSLMLVEFLDMNFSISIKKDEINNFKCLSDILKYIDDNKG